MARQRNTLQKKALMEGLKGIDEFFSAEELHRVVQARNQDIGIATVYRFLNDLRKKDRVFTYTCARKTIYSKEDTSHCHFICEKTGKIVHFKIDSLDFLKDKVPGSIRSFQIEVRGRCRQECKKCSK